MLLFFLVVFTMEDSIVPSLRLSALGSDFTHLIEDPLADIQFNPAQLGNFVNSSIYFRPEWISYWPGGGKVSAAVLYPKVFRRVCLGFLSSYGYSSQHFNFIYEHGACDTTLYLDSYPSVSFLVAFPFLKDRGFFGLGGTIKKPKREHTSKSHWVSSDSTFHNSDTSFYQDESQHYYHDVDKKTLWSIRGGQYLPFENSAVNIVFAITHLTPEVSSYDSSIFATTRVNIDHYGSIRTMNYVYEIDEDYQISTENRDVWQYKLGFVWEKDINQGNMRFFCQGGIGHGEITEQEILRNWNIGEYRYEYTSPDTSYSIVDTNIYEDIEEDIRGRGDIISDNEAIGFGFEKYVHHNVSFLIGLKIARYRNETEETIPDTVKMIETRFKALMPLGAEFLITPKFFMRGGITLFYSSKSTEAIIVESSKLTDSYFDVHWAFGLGFRPTQSFSLNLHNTGGGLASVHSWKLEGIYHF